MTQQGLQPRFTALEASTLTITQLIRFFLLQRIKYLHMFVQKNSSKKHYITNAVICNIFITKYTTSTQLVTDIHIPLGRDPHYIIYNTTYTIFSLTYHKSFSVLDFYNFFNFILEMEQGETTFNFMKSRVIYSSPFLIRSSLLK